MLFLTAFALLAVPALGQVQMPNQDPATVERFVLPPPEVDPFPSLTNQPTLLLTGVALQAASVEIALSDGLTQVPTNQGAFSARVPLTPNSLNRIFLTGITDNGTRGRLRPIRITHDGRPPTISIDYPNDRQEFESSTTCVAGRVSDLLSGQAGLSVVVNGVEAQVQVGSGGQGTFWIPDVPLQPGQPTLVTATATDVLLNQACAEITVSRTQTAGPSLTAASGDAQSGSARSLLPRPLTVRLSKADGTPFAGKTVTFRVSSGDGSLGTPGSATQRVFQARSDASGLARAWLTLGSAAGRGIDRVKAESAGFRSVATFCMAETAAGHPQRISVTHGDQQTGETGAPLMSPLRVWVHDTNRGVEGVPVTFRVKGGGGRVNGRNNQVVTTAQDGHAEVRWTLGDLEGNQVVVADFPGNLESPVTFTAFAAARRIGRPTRLLARVLDPTWQPLEGVRAELRIGTETRVATSDSLGGLAFESLDIAGPGELWVDGSTATRVGGEGGLILGAGSYGEQTLQLAILPEITNTLRAPIHLLRLQEDGCVLFDNLKDETLTLPGVDGFELCIKAGSMRLADGRRPDSNDPVVLSVQQVPFGSLPVLPPNGAAPELVWTLLPEGATFDPPVAIRQPNVSGLPTGLPITWLCLEPELGGWVGRATGRVTEGGGALVSNPHEGQVRGGMAMSALPHAPTEALRQCEPASNGCPTDVTPWVPDFWWCRESPGSTVVLANGLDGPCDRHDLCWGRCHSAGLITRRDCDLNFLTELQAACQSEYSPSSPCADGCLRVAAVYFAAVALEQGARRYDHAQDSTCACLQQAPQNAEPSLSLDEVYAFLGVTPPLDADRDLMADDWEFLVGLDPSNPKDALEDNDLDGLINIVESVFNLHPFSQVTNGDGVHDGDLIESLAPELPQALSSGWHMVVGGQATRSGPYGVLHVPNVPAEDDFGPAGLGSGPDLLSDDVFRAKGVTPFSASSPFASSERFRMGQGEGYSAQEILLTPQAPLVPEALRLELPSIGQALPPGTAQQAETTALYTLGSTADVTPPSLGTTYRVSNPDVIQANQYGVVTAIGEGTAYLTASNEGISTTAAVTVAVGSVVTNVEGFVFDEQETGIPGVEVQVLPTGATALTNSQGYFRIQQLTVASDQLTVTAMHDSGGSLQFAQVPAVSVAPGAWTDVGILVLKPAVFWNVDADGTWSDPSNWSTNAVPQAGQNVVISRESGSYTVRVESGMQACENLFCDENLDLVGGELLLGELAVLDGLWGIQGGSLREGRVLARGGAEISSGRLAKTRLLKTDAPIVVTGDFAVLEDVRLDNELVIPNGRRITSQDGLRLDGTVFLNSTAASSTLLFDGGQTLSGTGEVRFGDAPFNALTPAGGALVIAAGIRVSGGRGTIGSDDFPVINRGVVECTGTPSQISLIGNGTRNECALRGLDRGVIRIEGNWKNVGEIDVRGGGLVLQGDYEPEDLGLVLTDSESIVTLGGTIANTVLDLSSLKAPWRLTGTVHGGIVRANPTGMISVGGTWEGVSLEGTSPLTTSGSLRIQQGLTLTPGSELALDNARLIFSGLQSVDGSGTITFVGVSAGNEIDPLDGTVTLGPQITVQGQAGIIGSQQGAFVNQGTIRAIGGGNLILRGHGWRNEGELESVEGSNLSLFGPSWVNAGNVRASSGSLSFFAGGGWSNEGNVTLEDSTLRLDGTYDTPALGQLTGSNSLVLLGGIYTNSILDLSLSELSWEVTGTVSGGSITGVGELLLNNPNGSLKGVSLDTTLLVWQGVITDGLTVSASGVIRLKSGASLVFSGNQSLSGPGELEFTGTDNEGRVEPSEGSILTLASDFLVRGTLGRIGGSGQAVVNQGTIRSEQGGTLTLLSNVINQGLVEAGGGDIRYEGLGNSGTIRIHPGQRLFSDGLYAAGPLGTIVCLVSGTAPDQIGTVSAAAHVQLAGGIRVTAVNGFVPLSGDTFPIVSGSAVLGVFDNEDCTNFNCSVDYSQGNQVIVLTN